MRTTLTLPHELFVELREIAREEDASFADTVLKTLRAGLASRDRSKRVDAYRLEPVSMGPPKAGMNLTKALDLAFDPSFGREAEIRVGVPRLSRLGRLVRSS